MDFFKLREREEYIVVGNGKYRDDVWPDSEWIILSHGDRYETAISYNTKTFFVHKVVMTIYPEGDINSEYSEYMDKGSLDFVWIHPESEKAFIKTSVDDFNYYGDSKIKIEDEEEMDFMILKMKYM